MSRIDDGSDELNATVNAIRAESREQIAERLEAWGREGVQIGWEDFPERAVLERAAQLLREAQPVSAVGNAASENETHAGGLMRADANETIADIIAAKRRLAAEMEKALGDQHTSVEMLKDDADRIEAALKRELDELGDELKEQIEDLRQQRDVWSKRADELKTKCDEQYAKLKQVGNVAKLREALELCDRIIQDGTIVCACDIVDEARTVVRAALAAPQRNCDVGTSEEQANRFQRFCDKFDCDENNIRVGCPLNINGWCELAWAQLPYESEVSK